MVGFGGGLLWWALGLNNWRWLWWWLRSVLGFAIMGMGLGSACMIDFFGGLWCWLVVMGVGGALGWWTFVVGFCGGLW